MSIRPAAILLTLIVFTIAAAALPTWELGNQLAAEYNRWAALRNARVQNPGTVSAAEMVQWQKVKSDWRRLEKQVDAEYRGE